MINRIISLGNRKSRFSWNRIIALFIKEMYLISRDPIIFVSVILFPLVEVILFAALFNVNPRHLHTSVLIGEHTPLTRSLIESFKNSRYYDIDNFPKTESEADQLLQSGKTQFILKIQPGFTREVLRGNHPNILLMADGANPLAVTGALSAVDGIIERVTTTEMQCVLEAEKKPPAFNVIIQQRYNPSVIAEYYTVPCLMSIVLALTMMMLGGMSLAKEKGDGTMEGLLTTPARTFEVIISKMIPYIVFGYLQLILVLIIAHVIFHVPFIGNLFLLLFTALFFIGSCLGVGLVISVASKDVSNAMELTSQFFAVNVLFSGFLFPFYGMPQWAQWVGNLFPVTHFLRINLALALKGSNFIEIWPDLWPLILFMLLVVSIGIIRYRQTLD